MANWRLAPDIGQNEAILQVEVDNSRWVTVGELDELWADEIVDVLNAHQEQPAPKASKKKARR